MKGIFKLFPVAIAALAFVSCSDDLNGSGSATQQIPDNALRFSIGSNENMRAGFVGGVMDATSALKFRWVQGDVIRVYNDDLAEWDKYTYAGDQFGTQDVFTPDTENALTSYSIGVYPADEVEGVYMDKNSKNMKHIQMNLPMVYDYQEGLDTDADGSAGYRCDMPMYGNITDKAQAVTQMNFLSAYVRVYLRDLPKDTKYIALVSEPTAPNVQPLTGRFIANVPKTITSTTVGGVAMDDSPILLKDNTFKETFGNIVYARVNMTKFSTEAGTDAAVKDSAAICFPVLANNSTTQANKQTYDKLTIYAYGDKTNTTKTPDQVTNWATEIANGTAIEIATRQWTPTRRRSVWVVRYTEPVVVDVKDYDPLLPGDLTDIIATKANTAITDVAFKIKATAGTDRTLHSSAGYERNHVTTLPRMKNGSNIIIDLSDASAELLTEENWTINGNDFTGTLIIKQGALDATSTATSKIEINLPNADVQIIGDGTNDITNIDVQQCKNFYIGDGDNTMAVDAAKTVVVRDGVAHVLTGATVPALLTEANLTNHTKADTVRVDGGVVTTLTNNTNTHIALYGDGVNEAKINTLNCTNVNAGIEIYSEGKASIGTLTAPATTATGGALEFLTIKSKLTEEATGTLAVATVDGTYSGNTVIFTAAQLRKIAVSGTTAATTIMADEIDLNNLGWTGGNVAATFPISGNNHDATTGTWTNITSATGATLVGNKRKTTATGKNVIKNLNIAANGLFKTVSANISGLEIEGVTGTVTAGALAANIAAAADITNVKVSKIDFGTSGVNILSGLVGTVSAATGNVNFQNIDVSSEAGKGIKGRSYLAGMVGKVTGAATLNFTDCSADIKKFTLSLTGSTLFGADAGTIAPFIGGTTAAATINIYDCSYGTALSMAEKGNGDNNTGLRYGANADASDNPFFGGNPWMGACSTQPASFVVKKTSAKTASTRSFFKYTYAAAQMEQTAWSDATGAYTETVQGNASTAAYVTASPTFSATVPQTITYSGAATANHSTKNWTETHKYGLNIYSPYSVASLSYDNDYVE